MSENFLVEIISPNKSILKSETTEVTIPSYEGQMGILKDHIPLITFFFFCLIVVRQNDENKTFFAEEGTVEFVNNSLLILSSTVKTLSDLDRDLIEKIIKDLQEQIIDNKISDKEKYLFSHKIDTLREINQ